MSDLTEYGREAEVGESAARAAIQSAREDREPGKLTAFLIEAAKASEAWQDGAYQAIGEELVGSDSGG